MPIHHFRLPIFVLLCLLLCGSCKRKHVTHTGFYYWRTEYSLDSAERNILADAQATKLYVRFFDLQSSFYTTEEMPISPNATIKFKQPLPTNQEVVPVVFIPNEVLEKIDTNIIPDLAAKMRRKIERMCAKHGITNVQEYQLDCDWNNTTRAAFFKLVREFKQQVNTAALSVTIRLYQYKYPDKSGVPPADKGLLMFYNMGKLEDYNEENYILNLNEAAKYLTSKKPYALPLDVGLPLYAQGVMYSQKHFYQLVQASEVEDAISKGWLKEGKGNMYTTTGDSTASWTYMNPDISVRYERVDKETLLKAADMLRGAIHNDTCNIVFYHLDAEPLKTFNAKDIRQVVAAF